MRCLHLAAPIWNLLVPLHPPLRRNSQLFQPSQGRRNPGEGGEGRLPSQPIKIQRRSAAPVTPDDRWANRNAASQRATRPKSAANDPQEMRSTPVYSSPSFHSSHVSQPPIPAANENAGFPFDLDRCEFSGLYKPAQIDPRQDLTATPTRVNSSGFGLSSPAPKQPYTQPFSGLPSGRKVTSPFREAGEAHGERPGIVYPLALSLSLSLSLSMISLASGNVFIHCFL